MAGKRKQDNTAQDDCGALSVNPDKNVRELQLLANFYHKHGYTKEAEEIRQAIVRMREQSGPHKAL